MRTQRLTWPIRQVMLHLGRAPTAQHYGLEIARGTGLKSGTVYPILARLEAAGVVVSEREEVDPSAAGRPARRYYQLTGHGRAETDRVREEVAVAMDNPGFRRTLPPARLAAAGLQQGRNQ